MRTFLIILFVSLSLAVAAAPKVYKIINPDGSVEYSDIPQDADAEPIKLKPLQTITLPPLPKTTTSKAEPVPVKEFKYESIRIVSPKDDEAIRSNNGDFTAKGKLTPSVQGDQEHHLQWMLDGKSIPNASGLTLNLKNVDRGTHQLQLRVIDFDGKAVIETPTLSFHILRVSLGSGNVYAPTPVAP